MVANARRRHKSHLAKIRKILVDANVPQRWYSINKPVDNRLCIALQQDGIHIFIPERGERTGERIYHEWYKAIMDVADCFELKYTERVKSLAHRLLIKEILSVRMKDIVFVESESNTYPISLCLNNPSKGSSGGNRTRAIMTALMTNCEKLISCKMEE